MAVLDNCWGEGSHFLLRGQICSVNKRFPAHSFNGFLCCTLASISLHTPSLS